LAIITASWYSKLSRSLRTVSANLTSPPLRHTVCRDLTAKALGLAGEHELARRIERGSGPDLTPDHLIPPAERERRKERQIQVLRNALHLDDETAEAAWLAWRPSANVRDEACDNQPPAMATMSLTDIGFSSGLRIDPRYHLAAQHVARSRGWDWNSPESKRDAMQLVAILEEAGIPLDRPYPDQVRPTSFRSERQARAYLNAAGFTTNSETGYFFNLAPYPPGNEPEAFVRLYADVSDTNVSYHIDTNVMRF
jgi:hypothetical protein